MTAYEWGRVAGWILFPLLVAAAVFVIGRLATLRLDPVRQARARRGVAVGAITAGLAVAAINLSPLIKLGGDDVSRLKSRYLAEFQEACQKRCIERGDAEAKCSTDCGCTARELSRRATRDELGAAQVGATLRAKILEAKRICAKESPPN